MSDAIVNAEIEADAAKKNLGDFLRMNSLISNQQDEDLTGQPAQSEALDVLNKLKTQEKDIQLAVKAIKIIQEEGLSPQNY